jgi:predicted outer membrane lipoprotein
MNETKTYQNEGIRHLRVWRRSNSPQITNYPNKLYTIYDEFDAGYFYKLMKEGVYQEIEEGIVLHIKAFIEGVLNYQAYEICNAYWYKHSEERMIGEMDIGKDIF